MNPLALRARREGLGLNQPDLADALGVNPVTLAKWESGTRPIPEGIDADLTDLENASLRITNRALTALTENPEATIIFIYATDDALWAALPDMATQGLPAALHRAAVARAAALADRPIDLITKPQ